LRGMFLRGTGTSPVNGENGPALRATQNDGFESHTIVATTDTTENHTHRFIYDTGSGGNQGSGSMFKATHVGSAYANYSQNTGYGGRHSHSVTGYADGGIAKTRPVNYGVNYIIKL